MADERCPFLASRAESSRFWVCLACREPPRNWTNGPFGHSVMIDGSGLISRYMSTVDSQAYFPNISCEQELVPLSSIYSTPSHSPHPDNTHQTQQTSLPLCHLEATNITYSHHDEKDTLKATATPRGRDPLILCHSFMSSRRTPNGQRHHRRGTRRAHHWHRPWDNILVCRDYERGQGRYISERPRLAAPRCFRVKPQLTELHRKQNNTQLRRVCR